MAPAASNGLNIGQTGLNIVEKDRLTRLLLIKIYIQNAKLSSKKFNTLMTDQQQTFSVLQAVIKLQLHLEGLSRHFM